MRFRFLHELLARTTAGDDDSLGHTSFMLHSTKIHSLWSGIGSLLRRVPAARWVLVAGGGGGTSGAGW